MNPSMPTLDDVRGWPATVSVSDAAPAIGVSKSHLYELAARGAAPCRVIRVGSRYRVVTASLLRVLEGGDP